ncbi:MULTISPECIES: hypothetical protein [Deinococcus]|uniref:Uncharacterized protein n=2 Tax=Deinococcus soli (ex Cha et al. 2016) TaxID=1309411 RepID=A0ACC6KQG2_9DEIO|nr:MULTISPECIES: hypothetical protein [Deinococcus]MBX8465431.1 hypothetical protein [Deinococcus sp. RIT780]MDR6221551.1 hypothetical protein [Deinococcus soli (ex Cha et al. 2016)]MDR6331531.1 hypothetical protein [Deinococcus soli (ex Cha et al. 2016)]MDR6754700.1 hypothetical protein [Deinococcus soli (ex Cha et al. 2016)]NTX99080.1 hypothetical protein [Deinococcus sp. JMULE3]
MTNLELDRQPDYATVNELADRLGLGRRSALNVMNTCAAHLGIPIYTAERNQLQIKRADFDQVVELANLLRSVGLSVHQVEAIRACSNPLLWTLLARPVPSSPTDPYDPITRIEASLTDFLQKQEAVMKQQLDLLHHVVSLLPAAPAPTPTPVPAAVRREPRE